MVDKEPPKVDKARRVEIVTLDPACVIFNPKNAQVMEAREYAALVAQVKRDKRLMSVPIVREQKGKFYCVDGEHRLRAAVETHLKGVECMVAYGMTEAEANTRMLAMNKIHGEAQPELLGKLFMELEQTYDRDQLAELTAYKTEDIDSLIDLAKTSEEDIEKVGRGTAPKTPTEPPKEENPGEEPSGGNEVWSEYKFFVSPTQAKVIDQAFKRIMDTFPEGARNPWGNALEMMAADFLAGAPKEQEDEVKPKRRSILSRLKGGR